MCFALMFLCFNFFVKNGFFRLVFDRLSMYNNLAFDRAIFYFPSLWKFWMAKNCLRN